MAAELGFFFLFFPKMFLKETGTAQIQPFRAAFDCATYSHSQMQEQNLAYFRTKKDGDC